MKTNYFSNCKNLEEVKKLYKKLALQYHPDRPGGSVVIMQRINQEYENIMKDPRSKFQEQDEAYRKDYVKFPEIINQIIHFDITIEICGNWIWLSGSTKRYSKQLKEIGFFYLPRKQMWYWRSNGWGSSNHKSWNIDMIRKKYGSDVIDVQLKLELDSENDH
jgi:curved DNA-binding protein CbpA